MLWKQAANLHTTSFGQAILEAYMHQVGIDGFRDRIRSNCELYRRNRDVMVAAAREHLPPEVRFQVPNEGMFIWFELPAGCDTQRMLQEDMRRELVLMVPGGAFSSRGGCSNCMRASYSLVGPDEIVEGMRRFGRMLKKR